MLTIQPPVEEKALRTVLVHAAMVACFVSVGNRASRMRHGQAGGRPPTFDRGAYKQRNTVERCMNRPKRWRCTATCYEKTATIYLAGLHVAGIFLWFSAVSAVVAAGRMASRSASGNAVRAV
ncbi:hypothetical protein [Streptomyces sp. NBC_01166]|uniref:hypothetical protein n=1 Tax=Streptomyces sp. NBC_01166 TaxID=2903755 RepID=UPI003869E011